MLKLSNGIVIHQLGEPTLFLIAGAHGDEMAPILAVESILKNKSNVNAWIIPCLNKQGFDNNNRFYCGSKDVDGNQITFNLNREYYTKTKLTFMRELQEIIKTYKPKIFVDMHEHITEDTGNDFIWSSLYNQNEQIESKLRDFCKLNKMGITYQPLTKEYRYSSDFFARKVGVLNAYSTETYKHNPIKDRINTNKKFINFFFKMIKG